MKELVAYCMTKHADKIKVLADSALGGPRFQGFIRRHEMNIEPPPKEEEKIAPEKCVCLPHLHLLESEKLISSSILPFPLRISSRSQSSICYVYVQTRCQRRSAMGPGSAPGG